jgi:hypothetical protein
MFDVIPPVNLSQVRESHQQRQPGIFIRSSSWQSYVGGVPGAVQSSLHHSPERAIKGRLLELEGGLSLSQKGRGFIGGSGEDVTH